MSILKQKGLWFLKLFVGISLIVYLIAITDIEGLIAGIKKVRIQYLAAGFIFSLTGIVLRSYKWQLLLTIQSANLSILKVTAMNIISVFFNNFAPGSIGGDAYRVYRTHNHSGFKSGALSSVIMDRVTGFIMVLFSVLVFGCINIFKINPIVEKKLFIIVIAYGIGLVIAMCLIYCLFFRIFRLQIFKRFPNILSIVEDFKKSISVHKNHNKILFICLTVSFVFFLSQTVSMYFFAFAAGEKLDFLQLALVVPLVAFIMMIPISVNGIGLQEGAFFWYFTKVGVPSDTAFIIALIPRFSMFLVSIIGAFLYLFEARSKNSQKNIA